MDGRSIITLKEFWWLPEQRCGRWMDGGMLWWIELIYEDTLWNGQERWKFVIDQFAVSAFKFFQKTFFILISINFVLTAAWITMEVLRLRISFLIALHSIIIIQLASDLFLTAKLRTYWNRRNLKQINFTRFRPFPIPLATLIVKSAVCVWRLIASSVKHFFQSKVRPFIEKFIDSRWTFCGKGFHRSRQRQAAATFATHFLSQFNVGWKSISKAIKHIKIRSAKAHKSDTQSVLAIYHETIKRN